MAAQGVKLLMKGEPAMRTAAQILKTATPCDVPGYGLLKPGMIWAGGKMLISAQQMTVYCHGSRSAVRVRRQCLFHGSQSSGLSEGRQGRRVLVHGGRG